MIDIQVAGRFKIEAVNPSTGERRTLAPWFSNLITDLGLNRLGSAGLGQHCMVGTGTATPTVGDATLGAQLAHTSTAASVTRGAQTAEPYYSWIRIVFRFAAGVAAGNLTEIGIGINTTQVFSRTLIKDGSGNPTTITVLPSEVLDVTYELRAYPPADSTHTTTISGVTYTGTVRASGVTDGGEGAAWEVRMFGTRASLNGASPVVTAYNGAIGAVTAGPSGVSTTTTGGVTEVAYSENSLVRAGTATFPLAEGNVSGGIRSVKLSTTLGAYQVEFNPPIPKDNTNVLNIGFNLSWARKVI